MDKVSLMSSCKWGKGSNGFISVKGNNIELPLSLVGISESEMNNINKNEILNPTSEINNYLQSRSISKTCADKDKCSHFKMDTSHLNYITNNNIFQRAFYKEVNKILPSSLRLRVNMDEGYFSAENFVTLLGKGSLFTAKHYCPKIAFFSNDIYSLYLPKALTNFYFESSRKGTDDNDKQMCVAVNLVNKGRCFY